MSNLTHATGVHNSLMTWAVHDDQTCIYLAVTEHAHLLAGVFGCIATVGDGATVGGNDCPWLGSCDTDAYGSAIARRIYDTASEYDWDEAVIYRLLDELWDRETGASR